MYRHVLILVHRRAMLLLFCWCLQAMAAYAETAADPQPTPPAVPTPQSLVAVSKNLESLYELRRQLTRQLADTSALDTIAASLADFESAALPEIQQQVVELNAEPRLVDLLDVDLAARNLDEQIAATAEALDAEVERTEKALEEIDEQRASWNRLAETTISAEAPAVLHSRVEEAQQTLVELTNSVRARRNRALVLLDRTTPLESAITDLRDGLTGRIAEFQKESLASASQPLWRIGLQHPRGMLRSMLNDGSGDLRRLAEYARTNGPRIVFVFLFFLATGLGVSLLVRRRLNRAATPENKVELSPVLAHPVSAAVLIALVATKVLSPAGPQIVSHLLWAVMALPAAHLAGSILGRRSYLPIALITATVLVWPLRAYFDAVPLLSRALLLAEDAAGIAAVFLIIRRGLVLERLSGGWRSAVRLLLSIEAVLLAVSFVAGVYGEIGLARLLRDGAVVSLGLMMVLYGTARALLRIVADVLRGPVGAHVRIVRTRPDAALAAVRKTIVVAALAAWAWLSLEAFELTRPLLSVIQSILGAGVGVGWFEVTVAEALSFFGAIAAAFLIARVICFVLDEEFLPRLPLGQGVPYMISTAVRYLILLAGFAFALAALGIDLSKATILAGAFGVGIGFGLQNVVNNFVSGLILLFERPIRVGDMIEVSGVLGEVTRIGIRSSTVKTFIGSEVIVPNGDLIAKDVTNWTLSNRHRRVEVLVGVAYGSDPRSVIEVLVRVASNHSDVMAEPGPSAFLVSFGDSQLDFKLVCWVAQFSDGFRVASELRVSVAEAFAQQGLEIPFPQQDLRIVSGAMPQPTGKMDSDSGGGTATT